MKVLVVFFAIMLRGAYGFASCPPLVGCVGGSTRLVRHRAFGGTALRLAPEDISAAAFHEYMSRLHAEYILSRCAAPKLPSSVAAEYVERRALNQRLKAHASSDVPEKCLVINGKIGSGITTAVEHSLTGRDKVVYLELSTEFSTINAMLYNTLGINQDYARTSKLFPRSFSALRGDEKPVLVVEVDSLMEQNAVDDVYAELNELAVELKLVHAFILVSHTNVLELNYCKDDVWVGDLTAGEMGTFLDQRGVLLTDEEAGDGPNSELRRRILNEIGANPLVLCDMASAATAAVATLQISNEAPSLEVQRSAEHGAIAAFIEKRNQEAKIEVNNLLKHSAYKDTTRRLMRLLLGGDFPSGVDQFDGGFAADDLVKAVKKKYYCALYFNTETGLCEWYSPAHERAAHYYFEKMKRRWLGLGRFFV